MKKILIAAISENNVLGKNGGLVWDMPADREFLLKVIKGQILIMGRKSFDENVESSFFPGKEHIVITSQKNLHTDRAIIVHSIDEAFKQARKFQESKVFILGGGTIYEKTINDSQELIITHIHATLSGDTFFPQIDPIIWQVASREKHRADKENPYDYTFTIYLKK